MAEPIKVDGRSCFHCLELERETEGWEMPDVWWYECAKHPGMKNLRSFPFMQTKCKSFTTGKKESPDVC